MVVPKIDVDDLPRVLADSKRALSMHKNPTPPESLNSSHDGKPIIFTLLCSPHCLLLHLFWYLESDEERNTWKPPVKQGLGKIISPPRRPSNKGD